MKRIVAACVLSLTVGSPAFAAPILWSSGVGGNDHYYEYVSTSSTWDEAFAAADSSSYLGLDGYLATVTTAAEQSFIFGNVTGNVSWLGGHDRATEGLFTWVAGPEAGSPFAFTFWDPFDSEPNNCCGGEDDVVFGWGALGAWNDIGLPSFPAYEVGYIVEYSGTRAVPEPGTVTLFLFGLGVFAARRRVVRRS